jgi:hypothetical protein
MDLSFRRFVSSALILFLPVAMPVGAQPVEPATLQLVDAATADERLNAHWQALEARAAIMTRLFDREVGATLAAAFVARGVDELAMGYVGSWSGDVYYRWVYDLRPFYGTHMEVLKQSLWAIGASGHASGEELAYLDRGVAAWLDEEQRAAAQMQAYAEVLVEHAFHLGNGMRTRADPRYYDPDALPEVRADLRSEAERHDALADQVDPEEVLSGLRVFGQRRLFSPIEGVDADDPFVDPPLFDEALADACPFIEISDPPPEVQPAPVEGLVAYAEVYFPKFVGKPWVTDAVAKWRGVVQQLRALMAERPSRDSIQELVRWQAQRDRLLGDLVLAEEEIVWSLPGSQFTSAEIDALRPGFVRLSRARERAAVLAQSDAKVAALYETLASYEEYYNGTQQAFTGGDQNFFLAAALSMVHAQCSDSLRQVEGVSDELRREIVAAITELSTAFADVVQSRRNRGLAELDRLRAEAAAASGQPAPAPFRVHRPNTRKEYDDLARLMSERFGRLVSGGMPMAFPSSISRAFFDLPGDRVAPLTQAEIDRLTR